MTNERLPKDMIVEILYRLPVKPLIRFSCVSKLWSSMISDPQFAKSHFKLALSRRLLLSTPSQFESLDVQTPSFVDDSSARKLACPFKQPDRAVKTLGSCNGMVFVALDLHDGYYIWNPSTGLFLKLPNPGFASIGATTLNLSIRPNEYDPSKTIVCLHHYGFGYVSASDDYKVFVAAQIMNYTMHLEIFSSRADSWKRIESPPHFSSIGNFSGTRAGALTNEALHWLHILLEPDLGTRYTITAFDLGKEEFREIPLPILGDTISNTHFFKDVGIVLEGCLCVPSYERQGDAYVQLWVMMEYDVRESWTKLFKFEMFIDRHRLLASIFDTERGIVIWRRKRENCKTVDELTRFDHKEEEKLDKVAVCTGQYRLEMDRCHMIEYDESLLWLPDSRAEGGKKRRQEEVIMAMEFGLSKN